PCRRRVTAVSVRSTPVRQLPAFSAPLRLPAGPPDSLCIPNRTPGYDPQSAGPLRFLAPLLVRAAPLYPGEPRDYLPMVDRLPLIRSPLVLASPNLGGWPLPS